MVKIVATVGKAKAVESRFCSGLALESQGFCHLGMLLCIRQAKGQPSSFPVRFGDGGFRSRNRLVFLDY